MGYDRRLPGTPRRTGEEEEQPVDRGQDQARDEQRHALDDGADDEAFTDVPITPPIRNPRATATGVLLVGGAPVVIVIRAIVPGPGDAR